MNSKSTEPTAAPLPAPIRDCLRLHAGNLRENLRALPREAWILCLGIFLNRFGTFVIPFLAIYLTRRGFTMGQASIALATYGVGQLVSALVGGHLADTIGRRKTIILSMFLGATMMLCLSQARSLPAIVLVSGLVGLTGDLYRPASSALLADILPSRYLVTGYSTYRLALNAGWAFGPATAGFLSGYSFQWLFIGDALTSILFGIVAFSALPEGIVHSREDAGWTRAFRLAIRDWAMIRLLIASLAIGLVFMQLNSTFGLHLIRLGFSDTTFGLLLSFNGLLVVLLELPLTTLLQNTSAQSRMSIGYALIGLGFALNALARSIWMFAGIVFVFTVGEILALPVASAYVVDLAPLSMRGRYMGMVTVMWALGVIGAPTFGLAIFRFSPSVLWIACGGLGLLAAGVIRLGHLRKAGPAAFSGRQTF